jgi:hypothetical protein
VRGRVSSVTLLPSTVPSAGIISVSAGPIMPVILLPSWLKIAKPVIVAPDDRVIVTVQAPVTSTVGFSPALNCATSANITNAVHTLVRRII